MQQSQTKAHRLVLPAAALIAAVAAADARAAGYSYTNVSALVAANGYTPTASRTLSVNDAGEIQGFFTPSGSSNRTYFTLGPGNTVVTPYPTSGSTTLAYYTAAPVGGRVLNEGGNYLASDAFGGGNGGYVNAATKTFTAIPLSTAYQGSYFNAKYTGGGANGIQQQQTATNVLATAINSSNLIVGTQNYTVDNATNTVTHGVIYNPATNSTFDIGGGAAGDNAATGFSALNGVSNGGLVVGNASTAASTFRGTPTDAILGTPDSGGNYGFRDLASVLSPLATSAGGTYVGSSATNISPNGRYVVGTYTEITGTTTYTRSFRLADGATAVDLGSFTTTSTGLISAFAVNDSGTVVGQASVSGTNHAFVYANGTLSDLNALAPTTGTTYLAAYGINAGGQIAGYANASGAGGTSQSAFLLTPTPEPASLAGLAAAGGLLVRRRSRRA